MYPVSDVIVSVDELAGLLAGAQPPVLLDVRWALGDPDGYGKYLAGHLPGAVFVDLGTELAGPASAAAGRHPLPAVGDLQTTARRWGLRESDDRPVSVVAYDNTGNLAAARAWWLLRWAGLADVLLLDGGLAAWRDAGRPLATGDHRVPPGDVELGRGALPVLGPDGAAALVAGGGVLLDARAAERYRGEPNPLDPQFGHIPGARSAPTLDNLAPDGTFRSPAELAARFAGLGVGPGRPVGVYCGSGVTATHQIAALALAGFDDVALYPGSWSQWAALPGRPVATGPG
jgi:thiosulfate/3-mercaptopyruvate sulfurtransferase